MKISRIFILLSLVSSSFAATISIDNQSSCVLKKLGGGQVPEVKGHQSPDSIPAHARATITADISHYSHRDEEDEEYDPFFDIYLIRCAGKESSLFISGAASGWYANLEGDVPLSLPGGVSEYDLEEFTDGSYDKSVVLVDKR